MLTLFIVGLLRVAYFAIARYFVRSHFTRSLSTCRNRDEALVRQLMDRFVTVTCLSLRSTVPWMIQHTQSCVVAAEDAAALRLRSFGLSACTPSLEKKTLATQAQALRECTYNVPTWQRICAARAKM